MENLNISLSPHIRSANTTQKIMLNVCISLLPAVIAGCVIFGIRSLAVILVCVCSCVVSEFAFGKICKKDFTCDDLSAVVTGLLLALNLPANIPLWQAAEGSVFAIIFVKALFGGIGQNFANPAITARIFMTLSFSSLAVSAFPVIVDTASGATPLEMLRQGVNPSITALFLGLRGGAIGETCILALITGGIYLYIKKIITLHAPLSMICTVFLFSLIAKGDVLFALCEILSGGLFLGAFFMATDYSTTPHTGRGKIVFGIGAGIITALIRFFGTYAEGVSFGILFMNILTPYIDIWTARKPFGGGK